MALTVGTNSYCSLEYAKAWIADKPRYAKALKGATDAELTEVLAMACQKIDGKMFVGTPYNIDQALRWPRYSVPKKNGGEYAGNEYPDDLLQAQCEEALMIQKVLTDKGAAGMDVRKAQGSNDVTIGEIKIKYSEGETFGGLLSEKAWELLKPFLLFTPNLTINLENR